MIITITDETFYDLILKSEKLTLVDFWAEWCAPCKTIAPVLKELAGQFQEELLVGKILADDNNDTFVEYNIRNVPTLLFFKDGKVVGKHVGGVSKSTLIDKINSLL